MSKIIDLSKSVQFNSGDPFFMKVKVKHKSHKKAKWLIRVLGLPFKLFPKKFTGWADDYIRMGVHSTTHLDAPWHYSPECAGSPAKTIDEVPLDWCMGDGIVVDMKHKNDFEEITRCDVENFINDNKLKLEPGMIVLIKTGRDKHMGTHDFYKRGTGVSVEATEWLIDSGIKVMGIDQWGWDLPLGYLIDKAKADNNSELFWQAHLVGRDKEYCHIEQLTNLDSLPLSGFKVMAFPLKITGASAGPARVVAVLN